MPQPLTILVVDDDPDIRAYVRRTLETLCPAVAVVRETGSGRAALDLVQAGGIDVLVSDVQLPGLDGLSLCRALDAADTGPIPVLLISGESSRTGDAQEFAAGAPHRAFLSKPFNAYQLSTAFTKLIDTYGKSHE